MWRSLNIHFRHQHACDGDGAQHLAARRLRPVVHGNFGLHAEVLDDDLLDVSVAEMKIANRQQRIDSIIWRLTDADQDTGGERYALLPCFFDSAQTPARNFAPS